MKKFTLIMTILAVLLLAACAPTNNTPPADEQKQPGEQTPAPAESPAESPAGDGQEPNAWVVVKEAPIVDAQTGDTAGTAFPGFAISLMNEADGKASFSINFMDDKGENIKAEKKYTIDTADMEKKFVEMQAVIQIISVDMIRIKPGAPIYNDKDDKLLFFNEEIGPFRYIQKGDKGYMFTLDMNVVFVREADAELIPVNLQ